MYNPLTPQIAKIHQESLLNEADRLRETAPKQKIPYRERFLLRLGSLLIAAGLKLTGGYNTAVYSDFEPYQTGITGR
jgi:hypothetical protein